MSGIFQGERKSGERNKLKTVSKGGGKGAEEGGGRRNTKVKKKFGKTTICHKNRQCETGEGKRIALLCRKRRRTFKVEVETSSSSSHSIADEEEEKGETFLWIRPQNMTFPLSLSLSLSLCGKEEFFDHSKFLNRVGPEPKLLAQHGYLLLKII
jgi:hypothetical protein